MSLPALILGTAQWGWNVSRDEAFHMLDLWLNAGHRDVDAATNYPINKNPKDFRASEKILHEYVRAHGLTDLRITLKIGSLDNMRTPDINLAPSFIMMMGDEYRRLFDANLHCLMLHWDNRDDASAIHGTMEALAILQKEQGLQPGLSGIAHPDIYATINAELGLVFDIQLKNNLLQSDLGRYQALLDQGKHRFFAYGINAGGIKLDGVYPSDSTFLSRGGDPEKVAAMLEQLRSILPKLNTDFVRPPVKTMNHIGLIYSALNPKFSGMLLGVSSVAQLSETLDYWRNLETYDYGDVWAALERLL
ncbi:MAG: aldo/keto reductase [Saprospiraceae bacterium]|nr:aldo/keto reductase [Saprospiraceae bacterium]